MMYRSTNRQSGFTLVELMVALVLGLLITAAVISLFLQTRLSNRQNENIARMQENARFAMQLLRDDLLHADFFADLTEVSNITVSPSLQDASNCTGATFGDAYALADLPSRLSYFFRLTSTEANQEFSCVATADFKSETNALAVKRVQGQPTATPAADRVYLRSNGLQGVLYHTAEAAPGIPGSDWEYMVRIYYLNNNDTLMRETLQMGAVPRMVAEPLVDGIEYFHVEFGIDDLTNPDGIPNLYTATPNLDPSINTDRDIERAVTARIYVLARSPEPDPGYINLNTKTYRMGSVEQSGFNDRFYRRVYSTTVALKNPINRLNLQ